MTRRTYYYLEDGEWLRVTKRDHKHKCCDCALVHTVSYRDGPNGSLETKWSRDERATAAARRKFKFEKD